MAAQRANGSPITIAVARETGRSAYGTYDPNTRTLSISTAASMSTVVHETVHAMQHQLGYGVKETDAYGDAATKGLKPTTISKGYKTYTGLTDNDYAFRVYSADTQSKTGKWCEILTTSIDRVQEYSTQKDRSILELAMQIIKDYSK
jgi:hypothetical protein